MVEDELIRTHPSWCHESSWHETPAEQMKGDLFHWVKVQSAEQFKPFFGSTLVTSHPLGARVQGWKENGDIEVHHIPGIIR